MNKNDLKIKITHNQSLTIAFSKFRSKFLKHVQTKIQEVKLALKTFQIY